jgi:hypothetical protein
MDSFKGGAAGRIFGERLADKIPAPIPETSTIPAHLSVDTESAVRDASNQSSALARTDGQTIEDLPYSQRSALRSLPGIALLISVLQLSTDNRYLQPGFGQSKKPGTMEMKLL